MTCQNYIILTYIILNLPYSSFEFDSNLDFSVSSSLSSHFQCQTQCQYIRRVEFFICPWWNCDKYGPEEARFSVGKILLKNKRLNVNARAWYFLKIVNSSIWQTTSNYHAVSGTPSYCNLLTVLTPVINFNGTSGYHTYCQVAEMVVAYQALEGALTQWQQAGLGWIWGIEIDSPLVQQL